MNEEINDRENNQRIERSDKKHQAIFVHAQNTLGNTGNKVIACTLLTQHVRLYAVVVVSFYDCTNGI